MLCLILCLFLLIAGPCYAINWHKSFFTANLAYTKDLNHNHLSANTELNLALRFNDNYRIYSDTTFSFSTTDSELDYFQGTQFDRFEKGINDWFVFYDIDLLYSKDAQYAISNGPGVGYYLFKEKKVRFSIGNYIYYRVLVNSDESNSHQFVDNIETRLKLQLTEKIKLKNRTIYRIVLNGGKPDMMSKTSLDFPLNDKYSIGVTYEYDKNPFNEINQLYATLRIDLD
ncbi:MAG: DUF481 domain-containing protein [Thermodesulfobacteria bacterium]|nr:DUF481 domain-containing protein [Thermodesulfobacteriota bacterium]